MTLLRIDESRLYQRANPKGIAFLDGFTQWVGWPVIGLAMFLGVWGVVVAWWKGLL